MKKFLMIILIGFFSIILLAGCTAPLESPPLPNITQTPDLDLHTVNFTLFDQNHTPISDAFVTAVFDPANYDKNDSQIFNAPQEQKKITNKNGIASEFVMHGSVEYNLTVTLLNGTTYSPWLVTPIYSDYNWTPSPAPAPAPVNTLTIHSPTTLQDILKRINSGVELFNERF